MGKLVEVEALASFSPLSGLKKENRHALANKTEVREAADGEYLFNEGDATKRAYYVLAQLIQKRMSCIAEADTSPIIAR